MRNILATAPILNKNHIHTKSEVKQNCILKKNLELETKTILELHTNQIHNVYIDLDGVLVDHYGYLAKMVGMSSKDFMLHIKSFNTKEEREGYIFPLIMQSVEEEAFIKASPLEPCFSKFKLLVDYWLDLGLNVEILSSGMHNPDTYKEIVRQKQLWLINNDFNYIKANFVNGSKYKQNYANEHSLLIDDFDRNIQQWTDKNGKAILHVNMETTLAELNKIGIPLI